MADENILKDFLQSVDKSKFNNKPYIKRVDKPWGFELHWVAEGMPYMGKIIHIDEGKRLSLQVHDQKQESWFLANGEIFLLIEDSNGLMQEFKMEKSLGYTTQIGQRHRLIGGAGGGDVIEVSTPEIGNTYRLEDDYSRSTETEVVRKTPNRGWNPKISR